jgi:hypothetical protein
VRLKLVYVDFWSALKLAFLFSVVLGIITVVATFLIYIVLQTTNVLGKVDQLFQEVSGSADFSLQDVFGLGQVLGFAIVVAVLNIVVGTVLGAVAAMLYNLSVRITGGVLVGFTNA